MYFVYILRSKKDGGVYIGKTNDIARRLTEHNSGQTQSTKSRRPFVLIKKIECDSEFAAREIEKKLKKGYKREELKHEFNL